MATSTNINRRLIESVRDEPKKMLLPISDYEKVTVKSLDDACEPIKHLLDQKFKQYTTIAKMKSMDPKDGLSPDESASIRLYTLEWDVHDNSLYMVLNRTLRLADRTKLQPWFKYLKLFLTAFFKLPPSEHTLVWRGVREDLSALYPRDKEFAWWAISSCTASIEVLESPNYLGKSGARTIFSIQTNSGKDIRAHSYFENEDDILLPPGLYFKVIGSLNPAKGLHIIQLREISPPHLMLAEPFDLSQLKQALPGSTPPTKQENYSTNVTPKPIVKISSKNEDEGFAVPFKYSSTCAGRLCANCGECRDWQFTGDLATWQWLQGVKNWDNANLQRWQNDADKLWERFTKRPGATCYYVYGLVSYHDDRYDVDFGVGGGCVCDDNF